ncbi:hypothetical protein HELRODRAFT_149307, partial [Helobdella robusta]|uniref:Alpha-type protein kinase domain-containing protein n=1 Tax=Helobdella robusta TaxID=6412 RepID=T1EKC6_HELRO
WHMAVEKLHKLKDPWKKFKLYNYPAEHAIRHRYNAKKREWVKDDVIIKMENEPFNSGAMRTCYRLKTMAHELADWSSQSRNYVAKQYMEEVSEEVYKLDVQLQMDAKLCGEAYNRLRPPKQVDILQMSVLELKDRPDRPFFHLEHYIHGDYIKYNSNSGFVEESLRMTPQAFSHFTFEHSGHRLIVVDIQGVGDLWTDPQIHTDDGLKYGDGNLGTRGMALFFQSHRCNDICRSLRLAKFDLYEHLQTPTNNFAKKYEGTRLRGREEGIDLGSSPYLSYSLTSDPMAVFRNRLKTNSTTSDCDDKVMARSRSSSSSSLSLSSSSSFHHNHHTRHSSHHLSTNIITIILPTIFLPPPSSPSFFQSSFHHHHRHLITTDQNIQMALKRGARASCVAMEMKRRSVDVVMQDSVLGKIHHDLAKYHESGRFVKDGEDVDAKAALYHEQLAADLGVTEAALTLAYIHLGMPHDVLSSITVGQSKEDKETGFRYMRTAASNNDRKAMIFLAKAYETGVGLPTNWSVSYLEACAWYERALDCLNGSSSSQEFDSTMDDPSYQIKAALANMYLQGGNNLKVDPAKAGDLYTEAADEAMEAMKGKLANKFYALAEEAYA